ncbi:MAG: tetratricopeptide repeat protein [Candidatus Marinimicrobia bacterium]|nr:tetratricopeptide repeat protein [Candidatus Neomarinimicrobiota bacterium]
MVSLRIGIKLSGYLLMTLAGLAVTAPHRLLATGLPALAVPIESVVEEVYQRGMAAYEAEQWSLAIQEFESILRNDYGAKVLYYNLGNAYYRAGQVAGSVWAYEKALILSPGDDDARYNLALANLRVEDRIGSPDIPFIIRIYRSLRENFTPGEWLRWLSLGLFVVGAGFALSRIAGLRLVAHLVWPGMVIIALLALVAVDSLVTANRTREGIIYVEQALVYSAPSERSTRLFELHEGLKVAIIEQGDQWYQIELRDGKSGWLSEDQLRAL